MADHVYVINIDNGPDNGFAFSEQNHYKFEASSWWIVPLAIRANGNVSRNQQFAFKEMHFIMFSATYDISAIHIRHCTGYRIICWLFDATNCTCQQHREAMQNCPVACDRQGRLIYPISAKIPNKIIINHQCHLGLHIESITIIWRHRSRSALNRVMVWYFAAMTPPSDALGFCRKVSRKSLNCYQKYSVAFTQELYDNKRPWSSTETWVGNFIPKIINMASRC